MIHYPEYTLTQPPSCPRYQDHLKDCRVPTPTVYGQQCFQYMLYLDILRCFPNRISVSKGKVTRPSTRPRREEI